EPGLPNQLVFLDSNDNGRLDQGEPTALTDSTGLYQFSNLMPGSYSVREVVPSGLASVSSSQPVATATARNGATSTANFGVLPVQQDPLTAYIASLYGSILDRAPDVAGYSGWRQFLQTGGSHEQVVQAIWESPEHRGIQVDAFYQNLLHRAADARGRAGFVHLMLSGATEYDVQRMIIASPEYRSLHPDNVSFLNGVYNDVLARAIDPIGQSGWQSAMQNGMSRDDVARLVLTSPEHEMQVVDFYYQAFLERQAQPTERQGWLAYLLQSSPTPDQVAELFLASGEFFSLSARFTSS